MDATETFRTAVREVTATSVESVARAAGYSRSIFDRYLNRSPPSEDAIRALADALEDRAERLQALADELRETADERGGSDGGGSS